MAFVPYNFQGPFPDDFLTNITGDGIGPDRSKKYVGQPGWETKKYPDDNDNGIADFVDAYDSGIYNPDLYIRASQDHAGDAGSVRVELKELT